MGDALAVLQHQWDQLDDNWAELVQKCGDSEGLLAKLQAAYQAADSNYESAVNKTLDASDPQVKTLIQQIDTATGKMDELLSSDAQIANVVSAISDAVAIGTSLAAKFVTC